MGADALVTDKPVNWLETKSPSSPLSVVLQSKESHSPIDPPSAQQFPSTQTQDALSAINSLKELRQALDEFHGCSLRNTAMNLVFGDGNPNTLTMIIGEAPGGEEDRQGLPFVGTSGKLLDRMLKAIDLDRTNVYITNIIPWRPPGNRTPTPDEITSFVPFMIRHIELIHPKILILLGSTAITALLGKSKAIRQLRGHWYPYHSPGLEQPIEILPTFHPAYLLRSPSYKRDVWHDLLMLKEKLASVRKN